MILVQEHWSGKYAHVNLQAFQWKFNEQYNVGTVIVEKRTELNKIVSINQALFHITSAYVGYSGNVKL